jgi:hypothetical protein
LRIPRCPASNAVACLETIESLANRGTTSTCDWRRTASSGRGRCRAGLPDDPKRNRLAVAVPAHNLDHLTYTDIADIGWWKEVERNDKRLVFTLHGRDDATPGPGPEDTGQPTHLAVVRSPDLADGFVTVEANPHAHGIQRRLMRPGKISAQKATDQASTTVRILGSTRAAEPKEAGVSVTWAPVDETGLVGDDYRLHAVSEAELGKDACDVGFHRCLGHHQLGRDLGVGESTCEEP